MVVRLRNIVTGVVVRVEGDKASRMGRGWEPFTVPTPSRADRPDETWTVKQLRAYAKTNGIVLGTVTVKSDILAIIAEA